MGMQIGEMLSLEISDVMCFCTCQHSCHKLTHNVNIMGRKCYYY